MILNAVNANGKQNDFLFPGDNVLHNKSILTEGNMENFVDYLEAIQDVEQRERLREVLNWVIQKFPRLESKIAWNQPMFTDHGTFIIGFSVSRQHFAVSPEVKGIEKFSNEIVESGYSHGKNIFRIKWNDSVDYTLLERMIQFNIDDKKECTGFWRK